MSNSGFIITAKWVYPVSEPCIVDGAVVIQDERIEYVGSKQDAAKRFPQLPVIDYGDAVVLPGLINMHTHLDYSWQRHLKCDGHLFEWIPDLMKSVSDWKPDHFLHSARYGAQLSALSGTTFVVDSSYSGKSAIAIAETGLRGLVGLEIFGLDKDKWKEAWQAWLQRFEILKNELRSERVKLTCSPHAPYTVCPQVWYQAKQWCAENGLLQLAHVAESIMECNWIGRGEKAIDEFLLKVMPSNQDRDTKAILKAIDWKNEGLSPVKHLAKHGLIDENLIAAHCIQVDDGDIAVLKQSGAKIAHCPRSNARLRNGRAKLESFFRQEVNVGLGTDSLASTDSLNLLEEARFALGLHRAANPEFTLMASDLVKMMTLDAARALGLEEQIGSLQKGRKADIAVFRFHPEIETDDSTVSQRLSFHEANPADLLVRLCPPVDSLYVDGEAVVKNGRLRNVAEII